MSRLRYRLRRLGLALPRRRRRASGLAPAVLLLAALLMLLIVVRLTPTVREMAVAAARNSVTATVNAAVGDLMSEGELRYGQVSCFVPEKEPLGKNGVYAFRAATKGTDGMESYYLMDGGIITVNTETAAALNMDYSAFAGMGTLTEVVTTED